MLSKAASIIFFFLNFHTYQLFLGSCLERCPNEPKHNAADESRPERDAGRFAALIDTLTDVVPSSKHGATAIPAVFCSFGNPGHDQGRYGIHLKKKHKSPLAPTLTSRNGHVHLGVRDPMFQLQRFTSCISKQNNAKMHDAKILTCCSPKPLYIIAKMYAKA